MDINARLGFHIKDLRESQHLSLGALSERSGVSRSNISLIERGESSPTATVLDKLATALGLTLPSLFAAAQHPDAASPVARWADQPVWTDPQSGYRRRSVSPSGRWPLQLVGVMLPPGQRVAYETGQRDADIHQQIWMIEGRLQVTLGEQSWVLETGDCLGMRLNQPTTFYNPTQSPSHYLVALVSR